MSAEHYCKAPILALLIVAVSVVVAGAFSPEQCHLFAITSGTRSKAFTNTPLVSPPCKNHAAAHIIRPISNGMKQRLHELSSTSGGTSIQEGDDSNAAADTDDNKPEGSGGLRGKLRQMTGFSMTAFRATLRGITGFSLTALRASLRAATGVSVTATTKAIVGAFPLWFRYFMQPFLVLYYAPLMIIRSWVGETKTARADQLAAHKKVVEGWKHAVEVAEASQASGYWPVHVDEGGNIVANLPPEPNDVWTQTDLNEAVLESVEAADAIENE